MQKSWGCLPAVSIWTEQLYQSSDNIVERYIILHCKDWTLFLNLSLSSHLHLLVVFFLLVSLFCKKMINNYQFSKYICDNYKEFFLYLLFFTWPLIISVRYFTQVTFKGLKIYWCFNLQFRYINCYLYCPNLLSSIFTNTHAFPLLEMLIYICRWNCSVL